MGIYYAIEAIAYPEAEHPSATAHLMQVFEEVADERFRQDLRWGGREHDDAHSADDWAGILRCHVARLMRCAGTPAPDYRDRLVKVAAVAIAAAQAYDRTCRPGESGEVLAAAPAARPHVATASGTAMAVVVDRTDEGRGP